jgi:uncharacterized membrane protein
VLRYLFLKTHQGRRVFRHTSSPRQGPARLQQILLSAPTPALFPSENPFMTYVVPYVVALVVFGIIDAAWLNTIGKILYRPALADILLEDLRLAPAIVFYLVYPIGIVAFAVMPGLRANALPMTSCSAVLFGALAYGTYDLTNYATLRAWTLKIAVIDICYGALASGIAATLAALVARSFMP